MALTASIAIPSATQFRIKLFQNQSHQLERYLPVCVPRKTFHIFSKKVSMTHSGEPDKGKELRRLMREKLKEAMPTSVKDFPWKKAEDVIFSLSINQELLIPVGLFAGCILTDFLKEILQEAFRSSQEQGLNRLFSSICCFFLLVKLAAYFAVQGQVFLLHVSNGGLMQVFWRWRRLLIDTGNRNEENSHCGLEPL
ncbi:Glycine--tRNA ligase beta subunit like [Quillaja saponaria]|uniref:Glycine--tRNA ligase beta subunit like n=1 Tax=Quillaja saponaria TaxID=32244 RepID=A0AAD7PT34_QUISA|nr:Glycine--tRNA ligase beta subunit like [Quillaja saponaria]